MEGKTQRQLPSSGSTISMRAKAHKVKANSQSSIPLFGMCVSVPSAWLSFTAFEVELSGVWISNGTNTTWTSSYETLVLRQQLNLLAISVPPLMFVQMPSIFTHPNESSLFPTSHCSHLCSSHVLWRVEVFSIWFPMWLVLSSLHWESRTLLEGRKHKEKGGMKD